MTVRDGTVLYVNVFRPPHEGRHPVMVSFDVYGKDTIHVAALMPAGGPYTLGQYNASLFAAWEAPDPGFWVPNGYVVVKAAARGTSGSRGRISMMSQMETEDFYDVIEWCGTQPWSSGNVVTNGVSYLAMVQWRVGQLQSAAPQGDDSLGGRERPLSRMGVSRRHPGDQLLPVPGSAPQEDLAGLRPGRDRRRKEGASVPRLLLAGAARQPRRHQGADAGVRELVDPGAAQPRHHRRLPAGVLASTSGWRCTAARNGRPTSTARRWSGNCASATISSRASTTTGTRRRGCATSCASGSTTAAPGSPTPGRCRARATRRSICTAAAARCRPGRRRRRGRSPTTPVRPTPTPGAPMFTHTFETDTELTGYMKLELWVSTDAGDDMDLFVGIRKLDRRGRELAFPDFNHIEHGLAARGWLRVSHREIDPVALDAVPALAEAPARAQARARRDRAGRDRDLAVEHVLPQRRGAAARRPGRRDRLLRGPIRCRSGTGASAPGIPRPSIGAITPSTRVPIAIRICWCR